METVSTSRPLSKIEGLTTEIVQSITQYLDDDALLNFSVLSHTVRAKSHFIYGRRFFTTCTFYFHPFSLQELTQLASRPELAKYVKIVSFGREEMDLIDPIHDEDVKLGNTNHPVVASEPLDDWTLEQVRVRVDSSIIAQALTKLPNLRMVIASHRADSAKKLYRKVFDGRPYNSLTCVSEHCRPTRYKGPPMSLQRIFKVVAMALEQMRPERLSLAIGLDDYNHIQANLQHPDVWYTSGFALHRITYLKVPTIHAQLINRSPVCQILDAALIECLDIELKEKDTLMFEPYYHPVANPLYQLRSLQRLVVKKLWAPTMFILESIRAYKDRLTHVAIIGCSVVWPSNARHGYTDDTVENWLLVLLELEKLPHLDFLHLEELESQTKNRNQWLR